MVGFGGAAVPPPGTGPALAAAGVAGRVRDARTRAFREYGMRIAILCRAYRVTGGVSGHALGLAEALARLGHEVHVFTGTRGKKGGPREGGPIVHWIPGGDIRRIRNPHLGKPVEVLLFLLLCAPRLLFSMRRYDAVVNDGVYSSLAQDIVFVHSCIHYHLKRKTSRGETRWRLSPHNWIFLLLERLNLGSGRRFRRALFVSRRVLDQCRESYSLPEGRCGVVWNGIDAERFVHRGPAGAGRAALRARLGLPPAGFLVLFAGYNYEQKGLFTIIRALPALRGEGASAVVAGNDPVRRRAAERLAEELGVREKVHFLGDVEDMPSCYASCDALVLPAEGEAFSMVALEAMAAGLPLVVSRDTGIAELLEQGKDAIVLPERAAPEDVSDAIRILAEDRARGRALADAARAKARARSWDRVAEEVVLQIRIMNGARDAAGEGART
jgi:glycosyltransferase involved in cell wall biosynthesis